MYKRLLALVLTLFLVVGLLPITIFAQSPEGLTVEDISLNSTSFKYIFANGKAITIEAKGEGSVIKDAANQELTPPGFINDPANGYDLSNAVICGGSRGDCTAENKGASITINSGSVGGIIGGCYEGKLTGDVSITINGGTINQCSKLYQTTPYTNMSFIGGSVGYASNVSGDVHISITAGTITGFGFIGGVGEKNDWGQGLSSIKSAYLSITGDGRIEKIISSGSYGKYTGPLYIYTDTHDNLKQASIRTNDYQLNSLYYKESYQCTTYMLTNDDLTTDSKGTRPVSISSNDYTPDKTYFIKIDDINKNYAFIPGSGSTVLKPQIFKDYTIPKDYWMVIPTGLELSINKGVNMTNNGRLSVEGSLINKGSITGSGYVERSPGGVYTALEGGSPEKVSDMIGEITPLTLAKGETRGNTQITTIPEEAGSTYYYKIYNQEQMKPKVGEDFNAEGFTKVEKNTDLPTYLNAVIGIYEVKTGKVQRYTHIVMTKENLSGETSYDLLDSAIVAKAEEEEKSRIIATPELGNTLYYKEGDSQQGGNYVYNTIIDTSTLTRVELDTTIVAAEGRYISVYEIDAKNQLRKFVSVKLTTSNFAPYSGGLVADTENKRIYCNGAQVAYSVDSSGKTQQLYVYVDNQWTVAVPRNLDTFTGADFEGYTLYGGATVNSPDTGTLMIMTSPGRVPAFKGAERFQNYIAPDFKNKEAGWENRYTVKGNIDLNNSLYDHFKYNSGFYDLSIQSLILEDGAHLTLNTGSGPKVVMKGKYTDVVKGNDAIIDHIEKIHFTPEVDIRLYNKDGNEFKKDLSSGKYQVVRDAQVTIAGAISLEAAEASFGDAQDPVPAGAEHRKIVSWRDTDFPNYVIGFTNNNFVNDYSCYSGEKVDIKLVGEDANTIANVRLTVENINDFDFPRINIRKNADIINGYQYLPIQYEIAFDLILSAPTLESLDDRLDTFTFKAVPGYEEVSLYEYSMDGGSSWNDCTLFTIYVGNREIPVGNLQVRAKKATAYNSGEILANTEAFTMAKESMVIFKSHYGQEMSNELTSSAAVSLDLKGPTRYGYRFTGWSMTKEAIQAAIESGTAEIIVEAQYELMDATYTITVENGMAKNAAGIETQTYHLNDVVTATAPAIVLDPELGAKTKFSHWAENNKDGAITNILSYSDIYRFYVTKNLSIIATYVAQDEEIVKKGTTQITNIDQDKTSAKLIFVSMATVPKGCTIIKAGVIATSDQAVGESGNGFNDTTAAYVRGDAWSGSAYRFTWTKNITRDKTWYVRSYLLYQDENGNQVKIYGNMVSETYLD